MSQSRSIQITAPQKDALLHAIGETLAGDPDYWSDMSIDASAMWRSLEQVQQKLGSLSYGNATQLGRQP